MKRQREICNTLLLALATAVLAACMSGTEASPSPIIPTRAGTPARETTASPAPTPVPLAQMAADEDEPGSEEGAEEIDWGEEIGLDTVIELAKRDDLVEIQWHVMPNIIRVLIADGSIYHFRNENSGIDIIRTLENAGITVGKGGVTVRFSFCN